MISTEDYSFIVAFDNADTAAREALLKENRSQCAKTFLNLLCHVSKDQTIQYILILIDDMLQVSLDLLIFHQHYGDLFQFFTQRVTQIFNRKTAPG